MHRATKYIVCLLLFTAFTGCEKDFDVAGIAGPKKLVVNCQVDNQRNIKVYLTESLSPTGTNNVKLVADAMVELYVNDSLKQALPFVYTDTGKTFGCYLLPEKGTPGTNYKVKITHPVFGTIVTGDSLPLLAAVTHYQLTNYGNNTSPTRFAIRFNDNASQQNYYRINIWQWGKRIAITQNGDTIIENYGYSTRVDAGSLLLDTVREYNTNLLFSDRSFNGQQKQIDLATQAIDLTDVTEGYFTVELTQVSPSHYNYYKSLATRNNFNDGSGNASIYSNVPNGYGIFMANTIYTMTIPVK